MSVGFYTTIQGDYYDWISYKIYGTSKYSNVLMHENSAYNDVVAFDAGIVLTVPELPPHNTNVSAVPWGTLTIR